MGLDGPHGSAGRCFIEGVRTTSFVVRGHNVELTILPPRYAGEVWRARTRFLGRRLIVARGYDRDAAIERVMHLTRKRIRFVTPARSPQSSRPQLLRSHYARQCVTEALACPPGGRPPFWVLGSLRIPFDPKGQVFDFVVVTLFGPVGIKIEHELPEGPTVRWCSDVPLPILCIVVEDDCVTAELSRLIYGVLDFLQEYLS